MSVVDPASGTATPPAVPVDQSGTTPSSQFANDQAAKDAIDHLFTVWQLPKKVAWFDVEATVMTALLRAVETQGIAAVTSAFDQARDAVVYLAHGTAKP